MNKLYIHDLRDFIEENYSEEVLKFDEIIDKYNRHKENWKVRVKFKKIPKEKWKNLKRHDYDILKDKKIIMECPNKDSVIAYIAETFGQELSSAEFYCICDRTTRYFHSHKSENIRTKNLKISKGIEILKKPKEKNN